MERSIIATEHAPAAVGPYSQAVKAGGLVFCSGQIPIDPKTGTLVDGGIVEQTRQCLINLERILTQSGSSLAKSLKIQVFITDMGQFGEMNGVYRGFFEGTEPPARCCVEVSALPKGALVEMDAVGICD